MIGSGRVLTREEAENAVPVRRLHTKEHGLPFGRVVPKALVDAKL